MAQPRIDWVREIGNGFPLAKVPSHIRARVDEAHLRIFFRAMPQMAGLVVAIAIVVALALWGSVPDEQIALWLGLILIAELFLFRSSMAFVAANPSGEDLPRWRRRAWGSMLAVGACWAGLLIVGHNGGEAERAITALIVCGIAFGSFSLLSYYLPACIAVVAPLLGGLLIWSETSLPQFSLWSGGLVLLAAVAMLQATRLATGVLREALISI